MCNLPFLWFRRWQYDPRSSKGLKVLCLALVQLCTDHSFTVALWLTRQLGLYEGPCPNLLRGDKVLIPVPLMVSRDSFSLLTWARVQIVRSTACFNGCTIYVCVPHFYDLSALVGCWPSVYIRRIIYKFLNVCPFDYTAVTVSGKVERS